MALVYPHATLSPSKTDLMAAWLPSRPWYSGAHPSVAGSFRFDDPAGEVGMEGFLLSSDPTLFVALTYRSAPLDGAEAHLVGTMEHSELGTRYVYDACADPAFVQTLATTILTGAGGADRELADGSGVEPTDAQVRGSGSSSAPVPVVERVSPYDKGPLTIIDAGVLELVVARKVGTEVVAAQTLTAQWRGQSADIAGVRLG